MLPDGGFTPPDWIGEGSLLPLPAALNTCAGAVALPARTFPGLTAGLAFTEVDEPGSALKLGASGWETTEDPEEGGLISGSASDGSELWGGVKLSGKVLALTTFHDWNQAGEESVPIPAGTPCA